SNRRRRRVSRSRNRVGIGAEPLHCLSLSQDERRKSRPREHGAALPFLSAAVQMKIAVTLRSTLEDLVKGGKPAGALSRRAFADLTSVRYLIGTNPTCSTIFWPASLTVKSTNCFARPV